MTVTIIKVYSKQKWQTSCNLKTILIHKILMRTVVWVLIEKLPQSWHSFDDNVMRCYWFNTFSYYFVYSWEHSLKLFDKMSCQRVKVLVLVLKEIVFTSPIVTWSLAVAEQITSHATLAIGASAGRQAVVFSWTCWCSCMFVAGEMTFVITDTCVADMPHRHRPLRSTSSQQIDRSPVLVVWSCPALV